MLYRLALLGLSAVASAMPAVETPAPDHIAVVELFTSEGCSSCPPADDLLSSLVNQQRMSGQPIFALAFHVDYWDNLWTFHGSWKDPYSQPAFGAYQSRYVDALPITNYGRRVRYTPCIILNGQHVLKSKPAIGTGISQALRTPADCRVALSISPSEAGALLVRFIVTPHPDEAHLNLAIVERQLTSHIKAGENSGTTLHHENVVRTFQQLQINQSSGALTLTVPSHIDRTQASLIAYVQDGPTMRILGANAIDLAPPKQ